MKKSLFHLPEHKQLELAEITDIIVKETSPEMIILFGSYARGNWVEDRFTDPEDHDARYSKSYSITGDELAWLSARVEKLRDLTREACGRKIAELGRRSVKTGK